MSLAEQFDVATPAGHPLDRVYVGRREVVERGLRGKTSIVAVEDNGERALPIPLDVSVAFEWSYCGSGASATAWALLADHLGYQPTPLLANAFMSIVVRYLPYDGWSLPAADIAAWIGRHTRGTRG